MSRDGTKNLLLVEDEAIIAASEKTALEECGYRVMTAGSGEEALRLFDGNPDIDLVLLDMDLGEGMDGPETATLISGKRDVPVVFLSSHTESATVKKAGTIASYGYVAKDSGIAVLDASLKMAFNLFDERKRMTERDAWREALLEMTSDGIVLLDGEGQFKYVSKAAKKLFGYAPTEEVNGNPARFTHPDDLERVLSTLGRLLADPSFVPTLQYRFLRHDGGWKWIESTFTNLISHPGLEAIVINFHDISEWKRAEEALEKERMLLRALVDNMPDPIYTKDLECRKTLANAAELRMLRAESEAAVIGKTDREFYPEDSASSFMADDLEVMRDGMPMLNKESRFLDENGEERWFLSSKIPWRDGNGEVVGLAGISRDITDRKRDEERIERLLEEKTLLLKEVHHRVKNNLSAIISLLNLQAAAIRDPTAVAALEDAGNRVRSMMVLYDKLYRSADFRELPVAEYLSPLVDEILGEFPRHASVSVTKAFGDFALDARKLQPLGILMNEILSNIMKYAFRGRMEGSITVSASCEGNRVSVVMSDDGIGIPESVTFASSTGFGLLLVENLAKQLEGSIRMERGGGTRFLLEFRK